jgi:zinc/manganese transport system substrate-binding protein
LQSEYFWRHTSAEGATPAQSDAGFYAQIVAQLARRWHLGARFDQLGIPASAIQPKGDRISGMVMFTPSEFSRLRLQGQREKVDSGAPSTKALLLLEFSIGAHGAHPVLGGHHVSLLQDSRGAGSPRVRWRGARAEPIRVVTSIETFADLARAVGGANVSVESLARGYQDPHFVEAKPSLLVPLSRADLLVYAGLDLEIGWLPPLVVGSRNARIQAGAKGNLDASTAIDVLDVPAGKVDRSPGRHPPARQSALLAAAHQRPEGGQGNRRAPQGIGSRPWRGLRREFAEVRRFAQSKSADWSRKAASLRGLKVVPYHKSWTYVSDWLGLREIGYVELKPGIQPDPKHLAELILRMKAESVRVLLIESFYNRGIAGQVADSAGAKMLVLPSDVGATAKIRSYPDLVDAVLDALAGAGAK